MKDLYDIYLCAESEEPENAIDVLFEKVNCLLKNNCFEECDNFLKEIEVDRLNIHLLIGVLSITLCAKDKLFFRESFLTKVEKLLNKKAPERVGMLLKGLY